MPEKKHIISCGIAAEYNPFHNGHLWHLRQTRSKLPDAVIIAVLSANFVQRGLPAFIDKWARTKMALNNGIDLVLELPSFFSCNSGMAFAQGAVDILDAVGASYISFGVEPPAQNSSQAAFKTAPAGSETAFKTGFAGSEAAFKTGFAGSRLESISCILSQESASFKRSVKYALSNGASYSKAVAAALEAESEGAGSFASKPNNILALSYLTHINKKKYAITPLPIERHGDGHNESASKIRNFIGDRTLRDLLNGGLKELLPESSAEVMADCFKNGRVIGDNSKLFEFIQLMLLSSEKGALRKISGMEEGLEGLFAGNIRKAGSFDDFIGRCVCARYTRSRLQRQVIKILLGIDKWTDSALQRAGAGYARVLGYNGAGKKYLRSISKTARLDVVTRLAAVKNPLCKKIARIEFKASALWELIAGSPKKIYEEDMKPIDHS